ncbi:MAG: glycosyltransferase [Lachnospiraceae bacterium]|nr:glycosyltransferase [Lachnospiraceae bacterium]
MEYQTGQTSFCELNDKSLAIVIPVYRSMTTVYQLVCELKNAWENVCPYHIFLVDDGNTPEVKEYLKAHCLLEHVTLISLRQNYGQQNAVLCGLQRAGEYAYVAVMDDDLAHPVETLQKMYEKIQEGYDLVYGIPEESKSYSFGSKARDVLFEKALCCPKGKKVSSFRIMTQAIAKEVSRQTGSFFYFSAAALKATRKVENVYYKTFTESVRSSGYNVWKRMQLFCRIIWHYCLPHRAKRSVSLYEVEAVYPRVLVLGGSNCQLHALQRAKSEDMYTVLADYTKSPVGAVVADVHEQISTFDWAACEKVAKKHQIQGIMTMGTDQPVYTAAKVSQALELPMTLTPEQAFLVTNKKAMKQRMMEVAIATAPWMIIDESTTAEDISRLRPPYVIKPLDSQGQRGVFKLQTPEEVIMHLHETLSFSRCKEALVEEFYESDEMTVSGYISDGKLFIWTVTDRLLYDDPVHIGVCIGHRFPTIHMKHYEEIKKISEQLVESFGLPEGPFYLQLLIGEDGILVNELAARIGGAFEDVMIPWVCGFDMLDAVMKNALGRKVDVSAYAGYRCDEAEKCVAVQLMFCAPGEIASVTPAESLMQLPFVLDCGYNYREGDVIPKMENATARFGHAVITGTRDTIAQNIDKFYEMLSVRSKDGKEMLLRMYP